MLEPGADANDPSADGGRHCTSRFVTSTTGNKNHVDVIFDLYPTDLKYWKLNINGTPASIVMHSPWVLVGDTVQIYVVHNIRTIAVIGNPNSKGRRSSSS